MKRSNWTWLLMRLITAWKVSKYGVISGPEITDQKLLRIWTLFTQCMMMTYFSGIIDRRKALTLFPAGTSHFHHGPPSWIFSRSRDGFITAQNMSLGFDEWSCALMIATTPRCHFVWTTYMLSLIPLQLYFQFLCIYLLWNNSNE